jgi:peptidoglycan/xylan/chitin deacetylase (PgdA/CDA1 family)
MRPILTCALALGLVAGCVLPTAAQDTCRGASNVLGVSRTVEIDTSGGPKFGFQYHPDNSFLADGEVVLTFDDGPLRAYTKLVLDALDAQCTKATFFVVGRMALADPEMAKEYARRGHTVGTHTWSHANLANLTPLKARNEIELALSAVQHAVGQPIAPFFRFPYLAYSNSMATHLQNRNIATFSIDIDSKDYRTRDPVAVHRRVLAELARTRKGIILFHDIQPSTAHALPGLLAELQAKGYRIVHMRPKAAVATLTEFDAVAQKAFDRRNVAGTHPLKRVLSWTSTVDEVTPSASTTGALEGVPPDPRPALRLRGMYDEDWKSGLWRTY